MSLLTLTSFDMRDPFRDSFLMPSMGDGVSNATMTSWSAWISIPMYESSLRLWMAESFWGSSFLLRSLMSVSVFSREYEKFFDNTPNQI